MNVQLSWGSECKRLHTPSNAKCPLLQLLQQRLVAPPDFFRLAAAAVFTTFQWLAGKWPRPYVARKHPLRKRGHIHMVAL